MALVAAICPQCGGQIQLDQSAETGFCLHCGTKVYIEEALAARANASAGDLAKKQNYLALAKEACGAREYERSLEYAEKVLEFDVENEEAWALRAIAFCWLSTLDYPLFDQAINAAKHAIEYSDDKRATADSLLGQMTDSLLPLNQEVRAFAKQVPTNLITTLIKELKGPLGLVYGTWFAIIDTMQIASAPVLFNELDKMMKAEHLGNSIAFAYNDIVDKCARKLYGTTFSTHLVTMLYAWPHIQTYRKACDEADFVFKNKLVSLQATQKALMKKIDKGLFFGQNGERKRAELQNELIPVNEEIVRTLEERERFIADRCS